MNEKNILKRQHGLFVSVCFVVGFLVGTGIFFLPGRVLFEVGGDIRLGTLAWIIGGLMIAPSVYMFSVFAGKYEKIHGFVDYSEEIVGKKYGYLAGWFFAVMYQPAGYAIIAWITSGFTATVAGLTNENENYIAIRFAITIFFMIATFVLNYFAPKIPVKLNVATTVARVIPLILMGTIGVGITLVTDTVNIGNVVASTTLVGDGVLNVPAQAQTTNLQPTASLFAAISATAFAFNGWQAALAFNSEIKDSKRKFPIALMLGFGVIIGIYVLYFIGVTTADTEAAEQMIQGGGANFAAGTHQAFEAIFGPAGRVLVGFMIISGLGILNACCLGMSRAMYSLGRRGKGPKPEKMAKLHEKTNIPRNSMILAVIISFLWLAVIFANQTNIFGTFAFSLPDFYNYSFFALLIPIFISFVKKQKDMHPVKRFLIPTIATLGAGFMFTTYWLGSPRHALVYTITFAALAIIGWRWHAKNTQ
ncbi:MAG: APC family permease [Oscillospiraceae bacterium]|nr:APC family permease [Oscillospiraceae bacterium]